MAHKIKNICENDSISPFVSLPSLSKTPYLCLKSKIKISLLGGVVASPSFFSATSETELGPFFSQVSSQIEYLDSNVRVVLFFNFDPILCGWSCKLLLFGVLSPNAFSFSLVVVWVLGLLILPFVDPVKLMVSIGAMLATHFEGVCFRMVFGICCYCCSVCVCVF